MGLLFSKKNTARPRASSVMPPNQTPKYNDKVVNQLRDDLNDNPEIFVLNNLLLSVQFYENFEREMEILRKNQVSNKEIELNKNLTKYRKHCLLPDTVMDSINSRVRFQPMHGPKKYDSEPLLPQRMYIIHDNIEALYEGETSEYSSVDGPIHRAFVERAEQHQGYVQLKQVEFLNIQGNSPDPVGTEDKDGSQIPSVSSTPPTTPRERLFTKNTPSSPSPLKETQFTFTENTIKENKLPSDSKRSSLKLKLLRTQSFTLTANNSVSMTNKTQESISLENINKEIEEPTNEIDDSEYAYSTLKRLTSAKPLNEARANRNSSDPSGLPSYCITEIKVKKIIDDEDDDDEKDTFFEDGRRKPPVKKKIQDFYEFKKYFNSKEFLAHFCDVFEDIYSTLGFSKFSFEQAMEEGGRIHTNATDINGHKIYYEVIPAIATSWPIVAYEWNLRRRNFVKDPNTNILYKWPTDRMSSKIKSLQSYLLPYGYLNKRGINENNPLEWSLSFPGAERYMLTCMSHSQIRCYIFILALYKTFMEPVGSKLGLVPHHILNLIFWEIEKNYITWPEDRLGTKMIKVLKLLYDQLSKGYLPDYFVYERNLLESSPSKYLRISQSKLHNIIEQPVMHILKALRSLKYTDENFFPILNYHQLYSILTSPDSFALIHPKLPEYVDINRQDEKPEELNEMKENTISFWNKMHKTEDRERKWKRELRKQLELEKKEQQKNLDKVRKASVDSIDLEVPLQEFDFNRRRLLLEFFINHFISIAQRCFDYEAYRYAIVILEHSRSLAILLGEEPSGELEARPLKKTILENIENCHWKIKQSMPRNDNNRNKRQIKFDLSNLNNDIDSPNLSSRTDTEKVFRAKTITENAQVFSILKNDTNSPNLSNRTDTERVFRTNNITANAQELTNLKKDIDSPNLSSRTDTEQVFRSNTITENAEVLTNEANNSDDEQVTLRKQRPENLVILADVHQEAEVVTPIKLTSSVILEDDDSLFESSDL